MLDIFANEIIPGSFVVYPRMIGNSVTIGIMLVREVRDNYQLIGWLLFLGPRKTFEIAANGRLQTIGRSDVTVVTPSRIVSELLNAARTVWLDKNAKRSNLPS